MNTTKMWSFGAVPSLFLARKPVAGAGAGNPYNQRNNRALLALALAGLRTVGAQSIPIVNASFEDPPLPAGVFASNNGIPGWNLTVNAPKAVAGVARANPPVTVHPPTDGSQVGYLNLINFGPPGPQIFLRQFVPATLAADTTYSLAMDVYFPGLPCFTGCGVYMALGVGGQTPQGLANIELQGGTNTIVLNTAALPNAGLYIGRPLYVEIGIGANINFKLFYFDNVRLDGFPAINPPPVLHGAFGLFGPIPGETSRLHAFCNASVPPGPCDATLEFHDAHGVLLSQRHLSLHPGTSSFFDFTLEPRGEGPQEIVPNWFLTNGHADFSFEISDTRDPRARQFVNWGDDSVSKLGNLNSGPATIARGETGRLKAWCEGPPSRTSCNAELAFQDSNGRTLKQSRMTLPPGTAGFLDLTFAETRSTDERMEIVPMLMVGEGPAIGSFALLDSEGRTITQSYPAAEIAPRP